MIKFVKASNVGIRMENSKSTNEHHDPSTASLYNGQNKDCAKGNDLTHF